MRSPHFRGHVRSTHRACPRTMITAELHISSRSYSRGWADGVLWTGITGAPRSFALPPRDRNDPLAAFPSPLIAGRSTSTPSTHSGASRASLSSSSADSPVREVQALVPASGAERSRSITTSPSGCRGCAVTHARVASSKEARVRPELVDPRAGAGTCIGADRGERLRSSISRRRRSPRSRRFLAKHTLRAAGSTRSLQGGRPLARSRGAAPFSTPPRRTTRFPSPVAFGRSRPTPSLLVLASSTATLHSGSSGRASGRRSRPTSPWIRVA